MRSLSARNPRLKDLARLVRKREERAAQRAFVVEGPTLLGAAIDAGASIEGVYVDAGAAGRPAIAEVVARLPEAVDAWELPAGALDKVGDVSTSQGVLAVVGQSEPRWPTTAERPFVVVLAELADPGNVGTLIRAAAAAGASAVVCSGGADPFGPKAVRASAGALFGIDLIVEPDPVATVERLSGDGYRVAAAVVRDGERHDQADLAPPIALLLGSEAHGLSAELADAADLRLTVAMAGPTESLNVAMAGTLLAFEVARRSLR